MSEMPATNPTATIIPLFDKVTVGEDTYTVVTFSLARTIRAFALLADLAEAAGIADALPAQGEGADALSAQAAGSVFTSIVAALPKLVKSGTPALYSLIGLIVISNRKLRDLEEDGHDVDGELLKSGRRIAHEATTQETVRLFTAAVRAIGVETVLGEVSGLLRAVKS